MSVIGEQDFNYSFYFLKNNLLHLYAKFLNMKKIILLTLVIIASNLIATKFTFAQTVTENPKVLLITDDNYGSSFVYGDEKTKSIKQQFEDFGWNITIAAIKDTVIPCDWGKKTLGTKPMIVKLRTQNHRQ